MVFNEPVSWWSQSYTDYAYGLKEQDEEAWNGSLYFHDYTNQKTLKEVNNFPFNGLVTSTYGFNIKDLYLDSDYTKPFTHNTLKVNSQTATIYVNKPREIVITFNSNGGTAVKTVISDFSKMSFVCDQTLYAKWKMLMTFLD